MYNPEFFEPMNNAAIKEEEIVEKPCYENIEAPTPQLLNNYSQSQSDNNDFPPQDNFQQGDQTTPSEAPCYSPQENNTLNVCGVF